MKLALIFPANKSLCSSFEEPSVKEMLVNFLLFLLFTNTLRLLSLNNKEPQREVPNLDHEDHFFSYTCEAKGKVKAKELILMT